LRPGTITAEQIAAVLGSMPGHGATPSPGTGLKSPGQLASHYAPGLPVRLNATSPHSGEAYLGFGKSDSSGFNLSPEGDLVEAAANLFAMLRALDNATTYKGIAVAPIPATGIGLAINDRLARAAAPKA